MTEKEKQALRFKGVDEIRRMYAILEPYIKQNLINSNLPIKEQTLNVFKYESIKKHIKDYEKYNITR
jgi:hypothetical protein